MFALYVFTRAVQFVLTHAHHHGLTPRVFNARFTNLFIFQMCCWHIMYAWLYHPWTMSKSYVHWISQMSGLNPIFPELLRKLRSRVPIGLPAIEEYAKSHGIDTSSTNIDFSKGFVPCRVLHPCCGDACVAHLRHIFSQVFVKALKLYVPVHLVPVFLKLAFRSSTLPDASAHLVENVCRSTTFLTSFVTVFWAAVCGVRRATGRDGPLEIHIGAALCGLSLIIEKKERHSEFVVFCAARALHSVTRLVLTSGHPLPLHWETC
eukprot:834338_1